jgi:putative ABC transport system ATP-binding protein
MTDKPLAISCDHLRKFYGRGETRVAALRDISLDIFAGELLMLVGPSGCGKTTLISILAGILDRDEGVCQVLGQDFNAMSNAQKTVFRGQNIGFVFQSFNLLPALSAAENVAVPLLLQGVPTKQAIERARAVLEKVELGNRWQSLPSQLSGGQQQRVAIARALVHNPKIIVCDEPTSALDNQTGQKVIQLLKDTAMAEGRTLILVTHDSRIYRFADRIAQMDDGQVVKITNDYHDITH